MAEKQDVLANEKAIARRTQEENPNEVALCERFLNHLMGGFDRLGHTMTWEERLGTTLGLATLGYNSLRWAFELLLKGYYTQAIALSRTAWESWLHGGYINLYPERPLDDWRDFHKRPRPTEMRDLVAKRAAEKGTIDPDAFAADMATWYGDYSESSHPSERALRVLLAKRNGEVWLRLGGDYDNVLVLESTNFFCSAANMVSTLFHFLLPSEVSYHESRSELAQAFESWLQQLPISQNKLS